MDVGPSIQHPERGVGHAVVQHLGPAIGPGAIVVLRSPRTLRGTTAIVRRRVPDGWEVEVRTPAGTPMHLTVPTKAMLLV